MPPRLFYLRPWTLDGEAAVTQGTLFQPPPRLRGLWYRHLPPAEHINSRWLPIFDGRITHRFHDTTSTPAMRRFLVMELELGERVAARLAHV